MTDTFDAPAEIKAEGDDGTFKGLASTFGNKDLIGDIIERGAFAKSIKRRGVAGVKLLAHHDADQPIGVFTEIKETQRGLFVRGKLTMAVQRAREIHALMTDGALDALSIGFRADPAKQEFDDRRGVRILKEIDLLEVSVVTFPANERARISTVKAADGIKSIRDFERFLRDAGYPRRFAKTAAEKGFLAATSALERDAQSDEDETLIAAIRRARSSLSEYPENEHSRTRL